MYEMKQATCAHEQESRTVKIDRSQTFQKKIDRSNLCQLHPSSSRRTGDSTGRRRGAGYYKVRRSGPTQAEPGRRGNRWRSVGWCAGERAREASGSGGRIIWVHFSFFLWGGARGRARSGLAALRSWRQAATHFPPLGNVSSDRELYCTIRVPLKSLAHILLL